MGQVDDVLAEAVRAAADGLGVEPEPGAGGVGSAASGGDATSDRGAPAGEVRYVRAGTLFAVLGPGRLELRMPPDIGEAALRTPDTSTGERGPGWITFAPRSTESHVGDRARAWFTTAWRFAAPRD